jgi:hypothetical protein
MRCIAVVVLLSFVVGCAHFTQPPPTAMVEVTDGSIVPGPPAATHAHERPMSKRRALLITGGVIAVLGAVLTGVGAGLYVHGQRQQADSDAYCSAHPDIYFCGFGDAFDTLPGAGMLGVGVPTFVTGLGLIAGGANSER